MCVNVMLTVQYYSTTYNITIYAFLFFTLTEVLKGEIECAEKAYNQKRDAVRESIAFGRRSEGPPSIHYPGGEKALPVTKPGK